MTLNRTQLARQLRDLLHQEMGEDIDLALLLGPPEYARAVLSLCRSCGSSRLARLSEQFAEASREATHHERSQSVHLASTPAVSPALGRSLRH